MTAGVAKRPNGAGTRRANSRYWLQVGVFANLGLGNKPVLVVHAGNVTRRSGQNVKIFLGGRYWAPENSPLLHVSFKPDCR